MSGDSSLVDPAFEYNAPQFVDFTTPIEDDDTVDEYFSKLPVQNFIQNLLNSS